MSVSESGLEGIVELGTDAGSPALMLLQKGDVRGEN